MYYDPFVYKLHLFINARSDEHQKTIAYICEYLIELAEILEAVPQMVTELARVTIYSKREAQISDHGHSIVSALRSLTSMVSNASEPTEYFGVSTDRVVLKRHRSTCKHVIRLEHMLRDLYSYRSSETENSQVISDFLNCPTPDLNGIMLACSFSRPSEFGIAVRWEPYDSSQMVAHSEPCDGKIYWVMVHIPRRYGITGQTLSRLLRFLDELTLVYDNFIASYTLDIASLEIPMLVYRNKLGIDSFRDSISGVAWGMWLTNTHYTLLCKSGFSSSGAPFHLVKHLSNGGVYLQISNSLDNLSAQENKRAYLFMSPLIRGGENEGICIIPNSLRDYVDPAALSVRNQTLIIH